MGTKLLELKLNPLQLVSSLFLMLAPFLSWLNVLALVIVRGLLITGFEAESSLFGIANFQGGIPISQGFATSASIATLLAISAALAAFRSTRTSSLLGTIAIVVFLVVSYNFLGVKQIGATTTYVSPGLGLFVASIGVAISIISSTSGKETLGLLIHRLRRSNGLAKVGVFLGSTSLTLDFLNHTALGQLPAFLGFGIVGQTLHLGLVAGVTAALFAVLLRKWIPQAEWLTMAGVGTLVLLGIDASYNLLNGSLQAFLGHNLTETVLHLSVYYGVALVVVSRFLPKE